jgi:DNA-binding NarL/FixJ family response regulator
MASLAAAAIDLRASGNGILTSREKQIASLVSEGQSNRQIASRPAAVGCFSVESYQA